MEKGRLIFTTDPFLSKVFSYEIRHYTPELFTNNGDVKSLLVMPDWLSFAPVCFRI
jgi:hypothetical protein